MASLSMQKKTRAVLQSSDKLIADQRRSLLNIFICFFFPMELMIIASSPSLASQSPFPM